MYESTVRDDALQVRAPGARWLGTGADVGGGLVAADAAYNLSVPEGFARTDLGAYAAERRRRAGFDEPGPTLLTGVSMDHARGARLDDVVVYATGGLSNPAPLSMAPTGDVTEQGDDRANARRDGTVNLLVGTTRALEDGALAELLATVVEAKAATLLDAAGIPGTTSDAVAIGTDPTGDPATFAGSGTPVGAAARACVRESVRASVAARYPAGNVPRPLEAADPVTAAARRAEGFEP